MTFFYNTLFYFFKYLEKNLCVAIVIKDNINLEKKEFWTLSKLILELFNFFFKNESDACTYVFIDF